MIARIQKNLKEKDQGFTLIELLVVIIIIGILAAIAIPVFLNQREKAVDTGIKSDLRTIANEMESFFVDNQEYPTVTAGTGSVVISPEVTVTLSDEETVIGITYPTDDSYVITGVNSSTGTGNTWTYDSANGGLQDTPTPAGT
jgi:type IV pilus assembly protein PilA